MSYYETIFIGRQDISATQVDALADSFAQIVTDGGGTIHRREYWGLKTLSYRINKNRKGHYVLLNIDAPSDPVREMERQIRLNEDVLRYLTIRTETLPEGPSVAMQGRGDRDRAHRDGGDRGDRGPRPDQAAKPVDAKPADETPVVETPVVETPVETLEPAGDET